jgi:hypothetical protein
MTIIEARELALAGKTVICPAGEEWVASDFTDKDWCHPTLGQVFGVWREKKEPRRVYFVELAGGSFYPTSYRTIEAAKANGVKGERIVEFVEQL